MEILHSLDGQAACVHGFVIDILDVAKKQVVARRGNLSCSVWYQRSADMGGYNNMVKNVFSGGASSVPGDMQYFRVSNLFAETRRVTWRSSILHCDGHVNGLAEYAECVFANLPTKRLLAQVPFADLW